MQVRSRIEATETWPLTHIIVTRFDHSSFILFLYLILVTGVHKRQLSIIYFLVSVGRCWNDEGCEFGFIQIFHILVKDSPQ